MRCTKFTRPIVEPITSCSGTEVVVEPAVALNRFGTPGQVGIDQGQMVLTQEMDEDEDLQAPYEEPMGVFLGKLYWSWKLSDTLDRIARGEKLPFRHDATEFQNKEGFLPLKPPGYYKEYVHPIPGVPGAGTQRIVTDAGGEIHYTPNHYKSFLQLQ